MTRGCASARAKEMVEARYASLIANASDVILIVAPDGALQIRARRHSSAPSA
jgi:hypothetical protein